MEFRLKLRQFREKAGLSQKEIAEIAGVDRERSSWGLASHRQSPSRSSNGRTSGPRKIGERRSRHWKRRRPTCAAAPSSPRGTPRRRSQTGARTWRALGSGSESCATFPGWAETRRGGSGHFLGRVDEPIILHGGASRALRSGRWMTRDRRTPRRSPPTRASAPPRRRRRWRTGRFRRRAPIGRSPPGSGRR